MLRTLLFKTSYALFSLLIVSGLVFSPFANPMPVEEVEAGGLSGVATEFSTRLNLAQTTIVAGASTVSAGATTNLFLKEAVLDGIGWALAKQVVSSMIRSLINWVNAGFEGSPAFISDLKQRLLEIADETFGSYIKSLGGIGEFICSPFRLDVQAALTTNYAQARSGMPSGPDANICTLSGIGDNIQNFLEGSMSGWDQWFQVTSNTQNTPYGAYLEAEAKLNARLINEAGQEYKLLEFGDGFLSKKICEGINGDTSGNSGQKCRISTPGRVIADQLNKALGAGQDALIEADEINELIGALLNQLMIQAMQGINGLLGLGGDTRGYTAYNAAGQSFLDAMVMESLGLSMDALETQLDKQIAIETEYQTLINAVIVEGNQALINYGVSTTTGSSLFNLPLPPSLEDIVADIRRVLTEAETARTLVTTNLAALTRIKAGLAATTTETISTSTPNNETNLAKLKGELIQEYLTLTRQQSLTQEITITTKRREWREVMDNLPPPPTTATSTGARQSPEERSGDR